MEREGGSHKRKAEPSPLTEARKKSHKQTEQNRRQKISDKIAELQSLLGNNSGRLNKADILQGTIDTIKELRSSYAKMSIDFKQLSEDYASLAAEHERLKQQRFVLPSFSGFQSFLDNSRLMHQIQIPPIQSKEEKVVLDATTSSADTDLIGESRSNSEEVSTDKAIHNIRPPD
eukprot:TRINITY_DN11011_c0_g1_i1.p1 TRINITY_DN11011_c0_g1~~TRINITY_DN11011_c0_g1_i1.p1  ORF type:complete len:174 (-),score=33.16 TRINITY_DN11011_c0_g1_i1:4-525(-)